MALACAALLLAACATPQHLDAIRAAPPGEPLPVREGLWQVTGSVKFEPLLVQTLSAVSGRAAERDYPICLRGVRAKLPMAMPREAEPAATETGMPMPTDPTGRSRDCRGERLQTQAGWRVDELCTVNQPALPARRRPDGREMPAVPASTRQMSMKAEYWRESDERFSGFSRAGGGGPDDGRVAMTIRYSARFVSPDCGEVPARSQGKFGEP